MRQAVILAGGKATRMRPYTEERPKAMVEVAGRPIIEHQIDWLVRNMVTEVVVSCGYKAEVLENHLEDGSRLGVRLTFAVEETPLGRGGGLKFAGKHLPEPTDRWMALNGDVIADFRIQDLTDKHEEMASTATIALAPYTTRWGIADLDGHLIKGFLEKPKLPYWINAGIYCFEPEIIDLLPDLGDHEDSTFPDLALAGKLAAYFIEGYWKGIDTAKDIEEASKDLRKS